MANDIPAGYEEVWGFRFLNQSEARAYSVSSSWMAERMREYRETLSKLPGLVDELKGKEVYCYSGDIFSDTATGICGGMIDGSDDHFSVGENHIVKLSLLESLAVKK